MKYQGADLLTGLSLLALGVVAIGMLTEKQKSSSDGDAITVDWKEIQPEERRMRYDQL